MALPSHYRGNLKICHGDCNYVSMLQFSFQSVTELYVVQRTLRLFPEAMSEQL